MKWNLTLTVLFLTNLFFFNCLAQQPQDCGLPSPPGADDCGDACVYCDLTANGYSGSTIGYSADPPFDFCGTIENNQWFAFAAGTTTVEFTINASGCLFGDGVQGAIYPDCDPFATAIACEGGVSGGASIPIIVTANDLVVGQIYWFMVDGWAGDECDYDVTVTQGNTDPPPLDPPGPITPGGTVCGDETVTFSVPELPGASYYEWTLPDGSVVTTEVPFIDYTFGVAGQVCVQANNVCNFSTQECITIDVATPNAGDLSAPNPLCPNEIANISVANYNTDPDFTQTILITDASGIIVEIINGSSGTFTHDACDIFQVCSYNYLTAEVTAPMLGDDVNSIDCSSSCCDIACQNISFEDNEQPAFPNAPADLSLTCFDLVPPIMDQTWTDNCDGTGTVSGFENGSVDLCNGGTLSRQWEYTDACGNVGTHQQLITVEPAPIAAFISPPGDMTVSCDNIPTSGVDLSYTNNGVGACLIEGIISPTTSGSADICGGTITYTWEYTDDCNRTILHTQNITVTPAIIPVFINPPADVTFDCNSIPTSGPNLDYTNNDSGACLIQGTVAPVESGSADICGGVITYTWQFTDICGNIITHTQNVTITPAPLPAFVNPPGDMTVDCDNIPTGGQSLDYTNNGTGACLIQGTIIPTESGSANMCDGGTITYNWTYTDPCGNTITHQQNIIVSPAPSTSFINPPGDMTVTCDNIPTGGQSLDYTNNGVGACLFEGTVTPVESGSADICGGTITYTWEFIDPCNNPITHTQNITVTPAVIPAFINPPGDMTVTCENIPTGGQSLDYTNNDIGACLISGTVLPIESGSADICGGTITYTWDFTDQCGNNINHTQNITVEPAPIPAFINPPGDIIVTCDNIPTSAPNLDYTNNGIGSCLIDGTVSPMMSGSADECGGLIRFIWEFVDQCGNFVSHQQNVEVTPAAIPAFINPPADMTVTCENIPSSGIDLDYTNNDAGACLIEGTITPTQSGSADICGGAITYTWDFTDQCGNNINHTQTITVEPAPDVSFINPPSDINVTCSAGPPNAISLDYTNNGNGACLIQGSVLPSQSGSYDECGGTITYTWTFTNPCGQTINHTQNITIEPAPQASFIGNLPTSITVSCDAVPTTGPSLNYTNGESGTCLISGSVPAQLSGFYDECGGTLAHTWTFTDDCGRIIQHQRVITVEPAPIAAFTDLPGPQTMACADVPLVPPSLNFTNNGIGACNIMGLVPAIQSGNFDFCGGNITYTWTFTDDCNRTISHSQTITVEPAPDPYFVDPPADLTIDCGETFPPSTNLTYTNDETGNCANTGSVAAIVITIGPLEQQYNWTFTNPCNGVTITHTQTIIQNPTPDITINPEFAIVCEGESFDLSTITVTDFNNTNPIITIHSGTPASPFNEILSPIVSPFTNTTYYILATNPFGCTDELSFDIFIESPPNAGIDGSGEICYATPGGINLFDYLNGSPDFGGQWLDPFGSGVNLSNPFGVSLAGFPPGVYTFEYVVASNGVCPPATAIVELELLPEIIVDILEIACTDNPDFYEVLINSHGFDIIINVGNLNDLGNDQISITDIPIDESLSIVASNSGQFVCIVVTNISPPDCNCPTVEPPMNNGNPSICDGEPIPELSVTVGQDETANWYNSATGGTLLLAGSTTYTPANTAGPGIYTYYVEAENLLNGCLSSILTPVQLEIFENPVGIDALLTLCDDDDDGFVSFDLTEANSQINATPGLVFTYYETLTDAEAETNAISSPYTNTSSPQVLYVTMTTPNNCSDIVQLTLTVLPLPEISLEIEDEVCLGDNNGSVTINAPGGLNYSLDGIDWTTENTFADLSSGNYTAYVEDGNGCISNLDFVINPGLELSINAFSAVCDNNGTPSDATDDFYTISFTVGNNQGLVGTYTINDGNGDIGTYDYDAPNSFTLPAMDQSLTLTFTDDLLVCFITQDIGPLISCSTDCSIMIDQLDFTCNDNGTSTDGADDFYTININASAINGAPNNTYNVLIDGTLVYNFPYGISSEFTLPADGSSPLIAVVDNADPACQNSQEIGPLLSCSDECIITTQVNNIICDNQGTGDNPDDDTYTFELIVSGVNTSGGWESDDGNSSGTYDVMQVMGPFLIIDGDLTMTILDDNDANCSTTFTVEAPISCSFCSPILLAGTATTLTCTNTTAELIGTSSEPGDYTWTGPNAFEANTLTITVSEPGTYYLSGQYAGGCSALDSVDVPENITAPTVDAGEEATITCQITEVTLNGSGTTNGGSMEIQWFNQGGVEIGNTLDVIVTETGTYNLVITDPDNGCSVSDEVVVYPDAELPVADAGLGTTLTCDVLSAILDGSNSSTGSNITYEWINESSVVISNEIEFEVNEPGVYTLNVYDENNNCESSASVEITTDLTEPNADAGPQGILSCDVSITTLDGGNSSGAGTLGFEWLGINNEPIGNMETIEVSVAGTYTLIITDSANGCTASSQVEVQVDGDLPNPIATNDGILDCNNQLVILDGASSTGIGVLSFEWFDPSNQSISIVETAEATTSGTYTLIISDDANGCTAQTTVNVEENVDFPLAVAASNGVIDCLNPLVSLDGNASSGTGTISYQWLDELGNIISEDSNTEVNASGTYQLIVFDLSNSCSDTTSIVIDENPDSPTIETNNTGPFACNNEVVTLDGTGSTGAGTLTFEWQDVNQNILGATPIIEVNTPGNYLLIVTNSDNGCSAQEVISIGEDIGEPMADAVALNELDCVNNSVTLDGNNSTGDNIGFEWFDESTNQIGTNSTVIVNAGGIYTLVVTNSGNGCTAMTTVQVNANSDVPVAVGVASNNFDCLLSEATLDASASSATGPIEYEWFDPASVSIGTTAEVVVNSTGTYILVVTDQLSGCTSQMEVNITEDMQAPIADAVPSGILSCLESEVILDASGSTANGTIEYEWFNDLNTSIGNTIEVTVASSGMYQLIITDNSNGCTDQVFVMVDEDPDVPTINIDAPELLNCTITEVLLNGSGSSADGPLEFSWLDNTSTEISAFAEVIVNTNGIYTLVITDTNNGCSSSQDVEVFQDITNPIADAGLSSTLTCTETSAFLDAGNSSGSGPLEYEWLDANTNTVGATSMVEVSQPGIYTLVITAENGCTSTDSVEILISNDTPVADAGPDEIIDCNNNQFMLGGSATSVGSNITYQWLDEDGNILGTDLNIMVDSTGIYTLVVSNIDNNCVLTDEVIVDENLINPISDAGTGGTLTCDLENIIIGGSGTSSGTEYMYEWQNTSNQTIGTESTLEVSDPDTYILIVTNSENGCTALSEVIVLENILEPIAVAGPNELLTCTDPTVFLDGSNSSGNAISYEWFDATQNSIAQTPTIEVGNAGIFTLVITDTENGCTDESIVMVSLDDNVPQANATVNEILTCDVNSVILDGSGSTSQNGSITYEWLDQDSQTISTLENVDVDLPGIYTLIVTDSVNGCVSSMPIEVIQDINDPTVDAGEDAILTCNTQSIQLQGTAGNGNVFEFEWLDDNNISIGNNESVDVNSTGIYTLIVTNTENGCTASSMVEVIPDNAIPNAEAGTGGVLNCIVDELILSGTGSASGSNIVYDWQDANGNSLGSTIEINVSNPGVYTLVVEDTLNGCIAQDNVLVEENLEDPTAFIDQIGNLNCNDQTLVLDGTGSSPFGNLSFAWSAMPGNIESGEDTPNPEINEPGTYILLVTNNDNGCTEETSITIIEDIEEPEVIINTPLTLTCLITEIQLDGGNSSTVGDFEYTWTSNPIGGIVDGENTLMPIVDQAGVYSLSILNLENGCTSEGEIIVGQDIDAPTAIATVEDELDCVTDEVQLDGNGSSTGSTFIYEWSGIGLVSGANTLEPIANSSGNYVLTVTDLDNGCTETANVFVNENEDVPVGMDILMSPPPCFGDPGIIEISEVQGGEPPYLYSLDNGATFYDFSLFNFLPPGDYDVVVQDAIGCEYGEFIFIPETPELTVNIIPEVLITLGNSETLNAIPSIPEFLIDSISWSPSDGLSCTNCLNPEGSPLNNTVYTVTITDMNGCTASTQILMRVRKDRDIYIPNVFSPNGDSFNDVFMIFAGNEKVKNIEAFKVFDRWGELIFEDYNFLPNDPAFSWDGKLRGEPMNPAVFVYWARVTFIDDETVLFKGDVTLVR